MKDAEQIDSEMKDIVAGLATDAMMDSLQILPLGLLTDKLKKAYASGYRQGRVDENIRLTKE